MMRSFRPKILLAIAFVGITLLVESCGKGKNIPDPDNTDYVISYSGNLAIGDTIRFSSTASSGGTRVWQFGDGETSTQAYPYHIYYSAPHNGSIIVEDTVSLVVNNNIYHPNTRTIRLKPPVNRVKGMLSWTGGYFARYGTCCAGMTDHNLNDTSFDIIATTDSTIKVWSAPLTFQADSNFFSDIPTATLFNATRVIYTRDTIYFSQHSGNAAGGAVITYFHKR